MMSCENLVLGKRVFFGFLLARRAPRSECDTGEDRRKKRPGEKKKKKNWIPNSGRRRRNNGRGRRGR